MNNSVGNNIKRLRKEKGMSQEQLAEQLVVTHQAVSKWETGKAQPDIETLKKLSWIFNVPVEELIYEQREKRISISTGSSAADTGISFGVALAMVISYVNWHSIGWAILHGCLGWIYVIYYAIKYLA